MSPNPAGKKLVTAQSKTSFVSGGSVRNAVQVLSQCDATIVVISMAFNLSVANHFVETPDMIANAEPRARPRDGTENFASRWRWRIDHRVEKSRVIKAASPIPSSSVAAP